METECVCHFFMQMSQDVGGTDSRIIRQADKLVSARTGSQLPSLGREVTGKIQSLKLVKHQGQ